jgi:plasmid stability protein
MPQLTIRNVDEEIVRALKIRAATHGRSAEAEVREILRAVLGPTSGVTLKEHLLAMPNVGEDADFDRVEGSIREVDW